MQPTHSKIRIILVDPDRAAQEKLRAALDLSPVLQFVGQAADGQEAVQLCQMTNPDVALVNLAAPELDGIGVIRWLAHQWPQMTVLALSNAEAEERLRNALDAGAAGYLPADAAPEALAGTIEHVIEARRGAARPLVVLPPKPTPKAEPIPVASRRTTELVEAARIQSSLLPAEPPSIPGWEIAVRLQPARETSGDFYDFLPLEHGKYGLVIGDVSDKGLGAALFMAMTCTLFRTFAARQPSLPGMTFSQVNERILSDSGGSSFVTCFYGVLEPDTGRMRYVNAGHVPPLLVSAQKSKSIDRLGRTGMALGVLKDAAWQQKLVRFVPGDFMLFYTDGILEAENATGDFYGEQRLAQAARQQSGAPAKAILEAILADVTRFSNNAPFNDDVVLMVLKKKP
ncbi:MAG: SpoIIE family protein phosphatase [Anaerolineales bacterium]|nr:SpoIIE family protein phosphatase [Anaerolineales bacterium]